MNQQSTPVPLPEDLVDEKPKRTSRLMLLVSVILAGVFLYFALRNLDWQVFFAALKGARYSYLPIILFLININYLFRALRWRGLLLNEKHISVFTVFWANMTGYLGNNVLPARAGEVMRAAYIARKENISISFIIATGVTERLVDLAALVIVGAVSLFFVDALPRSVQDALKSFAIIALAGVVFLFLLPYFHGIFSRILAMLSFLGDSLKTKIQEFTSRFIEGIKVISRAERGLPFIFFTALIWLLDGIGTVFFALAFNESLTLMQAFLFIAALGLSSAIPSTPGYVGVYQFVAVTVLAPFGIKRESALAMILVSQALNLLIVSLWGGLGLWFGSQGMVKSTPQGN